MTIDGLGVGKTVHINWFLTGAGAGAAPPVEPQPGGICRDKGPDVALGDPIGTAGRGNAYGFGLISLTRTDGGVFPDPTWVGNTGFRQSPTEFFDSVYIVPDPAIMASEFGAGLTAPFRNPLDNTVNATINAVKITPHGGGDPHFSTWGGEKFSFHGQCDVILIRNDDFADGVGMHIHGRTKIHHAWSAFESAAVQIGNDILEVQGKGKDDKSEDKANHLINGKANAKLPAFIGGYTVTMGSPAPHIRHYVVHLGDGEMIHIKTFNEFVWIEVKGPRNEDFIGSHGLLGSFENGHMVARDGKTIVTDPNEFGMEWQVRDTDPQLFHSVEGPQYPQQCLMPKHPKVELRLGEKDAAMKACAHVDVRKRHECIADVLSTRNLAMAEAY